MISERNDSLGTKRRGQKAAILGDKFVHCPRHPSGRRQRLDPYVFEMIGIKRRDNRFDFTGSRWAIPSHMRHKGGSAGWLADSDQHFACPQQQECLLAYGTAALAGKESS